VSTFAVASTGLAEWLVTFALHSTIALACGWMLSAALGRRCLSLQETVLRWSLWVALLSSFTQAALLRSPWSPGFELPGTSDSAAADAALESFAAVDGVSLQTGVSQPSWWSQWSWQSIVGATAALAATAGLVWLFVVHRRLRRLLAARQPETDARVLSTAAAVAGALGLQQSPHVSRSELIATPIAFGFMRPEICLPRRAAELGDASLRAMLAHEVAHLRAADPAWMWGAAWLQALFPWQLLLIAVRRRWSRLVELRCDAIAANTATPTAVARCLLDVAEWLQPRPDASVVALGMAARPSALRERVEAALRGDSFRPGHRGASWSFGGLFLAALSITAPGVTTAEPSTSAANSALLERVRDDHAALLAEATMVRLEVQAQAPTPELAQLQASLTRRLNDLTRLQQRLEALLSRTDSPNR
jgi:beta-lactamase regulating signal transducer with metallopeptidase domain